MSIKSKKLGSELGISVAVLVMLALLIHPFWMPMGLVVVCIALLAVLVFGLCVFVWRETPRDEREYVAVAQAGRSAYLVGGVLLTIGVTVQTLQHHVDIWLVLGLAGMVLAKVISTASKE
jgi:Kef-type K+ transport system membrane component KefB